MNGNKFATNQIVEKPVEVVKGADFSWWSSKVSWTLTPGHKSILSYLRLFEFEGHEKGSSLLGSC
jgi:hypothetical protein